MSPEAYRAAHRSQKSHPASRSRGGRVVVPAAVFRLLLFGRRSQRQVQQVFAEFQEGIRGVEVHALERALDGGDARRARVLLVPLLSSHSIPRRPRASDSTPDFLKLAPQLSLRERDVLVLLLELVLGRARVASFAPGNGAAANRPRARRPREAPPDPPREAAPGDPHPLRSLPGVGAKIDPLSSGSRSVLATSARSIAGVEGTSPRGRAPRHPLNPRRRRRPSPPSTLRVHVAVPRDGKKPRVRGARVFAADVAGDASLEASEESLRRGRETPLATFLAAAHAPSPSPPTLRGGLRRRRRASPSYFPVFPEKTREAQRRGCPSARGSRRESASRGSSSTASPVGAPPCSRARARSPPTTPPTFSYRPDPRGRRRRDRYRSSRRGTPLGTLRRRRGVRHHLEASLSAGVSNAIRGRVRSPAPSSTDRSAPPPGRRPPVHFHRDGRLRRALFGVSLRLPRELDRRLSRHDEIDVPEGAPPLFARVCSRSRWTGCDTQGTPASFARRRPPPFRHLARRRIVSRRPARRARLMDAVTLGDLGACPA